MFLEQTTIHVREIRVADENEAIRLRDELGSAVPVSPMGTVHNVVCGNHLGHFLQNCVNRPSNADNPNYGNWSRSFPNVVAAHGFFDNFETPEKMMQEILDLNQFIFGIALQRPNKKFLNFITGNEPAKYEKGAVFRTFQTSHHQRNPDQVMCLHLVVRYGFMEIILRKLYTRYPSYEAVFQMGSDRKERFHFNEPRE